MQTHKGPEPPVLLDTHIWIWLVNGDKRLGSPKFLRQLDRKASRSGIRVSVISIWEVGMLESRGRISLPYSCLTWVHRALGAPGIALAPLTPEIAVESSRLPGEFHGDPADRIILATARILGATLVTQDSAILNYSKRQHIPTLTAFSN